MASTAIEVARPHASRLAQVSGFTDQQISLIAQTVAPGLSRIELAWFLYNAGRLGLEPSLDQIYAIRYKKGDPIEIVVGINGYRKQADDSGVYAGSDDPVFEYEPEYDEEGKPRPRPNGAPSKATVTVWKMVSGQRVPFTASVRWSEFYPGDALGAQYRKRPHNQLAIRAESHALRKAFPYQTERVDRRVAAPVEWQEAARLDEAAAQDPEIVRRNAARYDEIFGSDADDQVVITAGARTVSASTGEVLSEVDETTRAPAATAPEPSSEAAAQLAPSPTPVAKPDPPVTVRSQLGQRLADLVEEAARLEVPFEDCRVSLPAPREQVVRSIEKLEDRVESKKRKLAGVAEDPEPVGVGQVGF